MTKIIVSSLGTTTTVSDEDFDYLSQFKWHEARGYFIRTSPRPLHKTIYMHREVAERMGLDVKLFEIDHKSRDIKDNTRDNIRCATSSQQKINTLMSGKRTNKSGYRGVHYLRNPNNQKNPWVAEIAIPGKHIYLGVFPTAEDAARAYDKAAKQHHGEFAILNFPD